MSDLKVADNVVVSIAYQLTLDDGDVLDSASASEPLIYLQGAGNIIPGLETELSGLNVGDSKQVTVAPGKAYGEVDPNEFQLVPRTLFPENLELEVGMGLRLVDQSTGQPLEAYVSELHEDKVLLDFNHPLAGETLTFDVEIVALRQATDEEIAHGHAHTGHQH